MHRFLLRKAASFYKNIPIRYKLLLVFFIQISISLLFMGYMNYQKSASTLRNQSIIYSQDILKMIELRLKDFSEDLNVLTRDLLYDQRIYEIFEDTQKEKDNLSYYEDMDEVNNILRKVAKPRKEIQAIYLISKDTKSYAFDSKSGRTSIEETIPYDLMLPKARGADGKPIWYVHVKDSKVKQIFFARIIKNRDNYKEIGLMAIAIKMDFLQSIFQDISTDSMQSISILSENNYIIASRLEDDHEIEASYDINKMKDLRGFYIDTNSNILVSYISLDEPNWKIIVNISLEQLYREINKFRNWYILLIVCTLIILSVFSILTAIDIVDPINHLVTAMKKLEKGEDYEQVEIDRNDELGFLSKNFNKMAEEINYLMKWIYREQITRKEAEIKALQAQINPHFLFNTLESINWMAQLNGVPEISKMVGALSSLMEANIGRDNKLITLREEFQYIDNYIFILKNRYGERLEVCKEIDPKVLDNKLPRLLLQPLVENAIYHGIEKTRKKGIIHFKVYQQQQMITIEVYDNGLGMRKEEIEELNQKFEWSSDEYFNDINHNKRKSIGLENVNRRIKLFYGEPYGLHIESIYNEFTKVIVHIPTQMEEEGEGFYVQSINH